MAISRLWKLPAVRGLTLVAAFLLAISVHGSLRFRDGVSAGIRAEKAVRDSIEKIADAAELRARLETDSIIVALRDSVSARDVRIAKLAEARALAEGRYASALAHYQAAKAAAVASGDTVLTPVQRACDEVATSCAALVEAAKVERDTIANRTLETRLQQVTDSIRREEPKRINDAVARGITDFRATQPKPNRVGWFALGGVVGAVIGALR